MKKFCCLGLLGLSHSLLAGSPYQPGNGWHGILGLGILFRREAIEAVDHRIWPLPYMIMRRGNFFIERLKVGYRVIDGAEGHVNMIIRPRLEGFEANNSPLLEGMADRELSLDAGISSMMRQGTVEINFSAMTDVLRHSKGEEMAISIGKTYILTGKKTLFTPRIGIKWQNDELVNYYYGVRTTEAKEERPAYQGEATVNYTGAINATYSLSKRSTLFMDVEYERFGDDISDSPLVDGEQIFNIFLGYGWQF
ncbi:MAG: hypothetical protein DRQ49_08745 [Gammaproteobacteria bacterium]|nr:MAG: hypothetical protein DRQ49_08745 [Gammaproteobacteria bacterium]RKZ44414.1 MAG: hypothetical protein DRQ41_02875 [Gammaproteobacteria bacterium]RKZ74648.1 MAG: hypothetical protein DRQ57_10275 [Gammaproteobacteria bacterium]